MFKKYMAMFMACVLTLALSAPIVAYASSTGKPASPSSITSSGSGTVTITYTSITELPVLKIKIENSAGLILNPYKLRYDDTAADNIIASSQFKLKDTSSGSSATDSSNENSPATYRQIISSPMVIKSETEVPVLVGASVATEVTTGITMKATPIAYTAVGRTPADTGKVIYMWLAADASVEGDFADDNTLPDPEVAVINRALRLTPAKNASQTLVLSATVGRVAAVKNDDFVVIPAAVEDNGTVTPRYAAFVFNGEMVVAPKTGTNNTPWLATDTVTPTVTLSLSIMENDWSSELSADNNA